MKKLTLFFIFYFLFSILFSGCLVRTYTVKKPRVDLEITGNQGYLYGESKPSKPKKKLPPERKITVIEVELGEHPPKGELRKEEILKPEQIKEPKVSEQPTSDEVILEEPKQSSSEKLKQKPVYTEKKEYEYKVYTVQKDDTLQKISYKFYNTTKGWKKIYQANKDILKGPDKVYPGQVLKIPLK